MVYQTSEQLRGITMLSENDPPMIFHLSLKNLDENIDKLYKYDDVIKRFEEGISNYNFINSLNGPMTDLSYNLQN